MRIVFLMPHQRHARRFESVLEELAVRGHELHLALKGEIHPEANDLISRLAQVGRVSRARAAVRSDRWAGLALGLRHGIDYLRYLAPPYEDAPKLRARSAGFAPAVLVRLAGWPLLRRPAGVRLLDRLLRGLERAIPQSVEVREFLRSARPDLLLISPLVDRQWQDDYVRCARALGIASALCVASWDNLTNKGLIRQVPDLVYLWNDDQRREAVELHGVPAERVVATGAHSFDHWFGWRPSTGGEEFRHRLGLEPDRPILLYVGSSKFIAPDEPPFAERWLRALREHPDERLRTVNVLVRPHPTSGPEWEESALARMAGVAVWPPRGAVNLDDERKSAYFDSIHHSAAVVGVNTSALIESAIVGRPVYTVLDPQFDETQEGTLHFHYLLRHNGGPLTVAGSFDEHFGQLADLLSGPPPDGEHERRFVERFVRPRGLDVAATQVMADEIEAQAGGAAARPPASPGRPPVPAGADPA